MARGGIEQSSQVIAHPAMLRQQGFSNRGYVEAVKDQGMPPWPAFRLQGLGLAPEAKDVQLRFRHQGKGRGLRVMWRSASDAARFHVKEESAPLEPLAPLRTPRCRDGRDSQPVSAAHRLAARICPRFPSMSTGSWPLRRSHIFRATAQPSASADQYIGPPVR